MSTMTDTTTDTGAWTELVEHFDEEVPCGHPQHDSDLDAHAGNASWMYSCRCPGCGHEARVPVCDMFRVSLETGYFWVRDRLSCHGLFPVTEWTFTFREL